MSERIQEGLFSSSRKQSGAVALIGVVGVCASAVMYQITAQGPGVTPDSTTYIETARALLARNGFFVNGQPVTHYPPVFPLLLVGVSSLCSKSARGGFFLPAACPRHHASARRNCRFLHFLERTMPRPLLPQAFLHANP